MNGVRTSFQDHPTPNELLLWMKAYRLAALAAIVLMLCLMGSGFVASSRSAVVVEPERINPNTAPLGSLVRLDGIGRARALDILHYRQVNAEFETVFESAGDLQAIHGIGPKTAEKLEPWLTFEEQNTTQ